MKKYKPIRLSELEDVETVQTSTDARAPYSPYNKEAEITTVISAMMTKVHDLTKRVDELEKQNETNRL